MIARARAQSQDIEILVGLFGLARQANPVFGGRFRQLALAEWCDKLDMKMRVETGRAPSLPVLFYRPAPFRCKRSAATESPPIITIVCFAAHHSAARAASGGTSLLYEVSSHLVQNHVWRSTHQGNGGEFSPHILERMSAMV